MHRPPARSIAPLLGAVGLLCAGTASADPASWLFVGGGDGRIDAGGATERDHSLLHIETGLGSPAEGAFAVGGMFKMLTFFTRGTDLQLTLRGATGGFVRGDFGIALDAGGFERFWEQGSYGFAGALVLGAPYGLQAALQTEVGNDANKTYAVVLGVDLLRLTVFRSVGRDWLPNPSPGFAAR